MRLPGKAKMLLAKRGSPHEIIINEVINDGVVFHAFLPAISKCFNYART